MKNLKSTLDRIDNRGYGAYKDLQGEYDFGKFTLHVDKVQRDPFAPPSLIRIRTHDNAFDHALYENPVRRFAFEDFLTRRAEEAIKKAVRGNRGSGKSGRVEIQRPSQIVIPRTSCVVDENGVEARMAVGLPAKGRTVDGRAAREVLLDELPEIVHNALTHQGIDTNAALKHAETVEDAEHLRDRLAELKLVAFVADGAILPRESGASDRPMHDGAKPFATPEEYRTEVELPNRGKVTGMGVPEGVTLIVGGGFHGKSTLLSALSWGVYDHLPGDGREFVVTRDDAVKIRAEDGRSVAGVDISGSIGELPGGGKTQDFSTTNASGSTSQAANIAEALEVGSSLFLVDEDTSATNFMIRDERMRELIKREPISPFIDVVGPLHRDLGVSTIVVVGGVGDYLDVADHVVLLEDYAATDATERAAEVTREFPPRAPIGGAGISHPRDRRLQARSIDLSRGKKETARGKGLSTVELGRENVDLTYLEQLAEGGQTEAIARIIGKFARSKDPASAREVAESALADIEKNCLDSLGNFKGHPGEMSQPRPQEVAAAINRIRSLKATTG